MRKLIIPSLLLILALAVFSPLSSTTAHGDNLVPADRQALILVRVLAYDKDLTQRAGGSLTVAILYIPGNSNSEAIMGDMVKAFGATTKLEVQGMPLSVAAIPYENGDSLRTAIDAQGIDALYLAGEMSEQINTITTVSREKKVATMTPYKTSAKAGVSIAVTLKGDKPSIVVNIAASKAEGLNLSSDLLGLAELI